MDEDTSGQSRSKRQKVDKFGRFAALKKLKELKGQKHKYDLQEQIDSVYDIVDEKEFEKRSRNLGMEDWIEDDGTGYIEDGRDFFDDEDAYSDEQTESSSKYNKKSKKRHRDKDEKPQGVSKGSIRSLFNNATTKKKETKVKLDEDDVLADILGEIGPAKKMKTSSESNENIINDNQPSNSCQSNLPSRSSKNDEAIAKEYMQNFLSSLKKKDTPSTSKNSDADDALINSILIEPKIYQKPPQAAIIAENVVANKKVIENVNQKIQINEIKKSVEKTSVTVQKSVSNVSEIKKSTEENYQLDAFDEPFEPINENVEKPKIQEQKNVTTLKRDNEQANNDKHFSASDWENIFKVDVFKDDNFASLEGNGTASTNGTTSTAVADDKLLNNKESVRMWFWDAWEDLQKHTGQVYLFGRIQNGKEYKSACVLIENVDRVLYLLPRQYALDPITKEKTKQLVTFKDMYNEFAEQIAKELNLTTFSSRKVTKNFAFHLPGVNVPETCEYLEIRYEGKKSTPNIKRKYNTIEHIFGTNTSALETFLLECKIKGPCWLNIKNFYLKNQPMSWCKLEMICSSTNCISVASALDEQTTAGPIVIQPPPPLVFIALNIKTALNPKTSKNEIVMISCLVNNRFAIDKPPPNPPINRHFCGFTRPPAQNWPLDMNEKLNAFKSTKLSKFDNERTLLSWFLATYQTIDPDLVVAHDANDLQLDALIDRITTLKVPMWARLGRLRFSLVAGKKFRDFYCGRMVCDVKHSAEELIKSRSYDLDTLCTHVLKLKEEERVDVSNDDLYRMYETGDGLLKLVSLTMNDCLYIVRLMCELNVLPLALQITNICGNLMSRTLQGGRSERNEYLLLHSFIEKDYIVPDKKQREINWNNTSPVEGVADSTTQTTTTTTTGRKKAAYSGGLVLEPQKGFYDKFVLLMDFNSLYPSIIQEYNICFTTITEPDEPDGIPALPDSGIEQGILPRQIRRLVESRREVKKLMSNPDLEPEQKMQYNIRQLALKLTANSMYGCLGFSHSRFFAQHLAALVTYKGREILMDTKSLVQKLNFNVIYGDTDSIMIATSSVDYDQVYKIGQNIKQAVNKVYKQIELDIDGVFKYLLLLKKKKYAAVLISKTKTGELHYTQEHKGLDIVRRDWSQISVMAGKVVLDEILSDNQLDEKIENIHSHLEKFRDNLNEGLVPLPLLTITKQLTKSPKDYATISTLPHVQVALRMNSERNRRYKKGDMVSYIICEDGTENVPMQRAYHLDELKSNPKLKVDINYYLAQQIHPVVSRLCEPLEGTDASRIASCLGLDPSKFKASAQRVQKERMEEGDGAQLIKTASQKYRQCEKFKFTCITCKTENIVASAFKPLEKTHVAVLEKCSNVKCTTGPYQYITSIRNELILNVRRYIRRFYQNWMVCDDPACNKNTRNYSHISFNKRPLCLICKNGTLIRQYSERDLFNQLSYFQYMFDLSKHDKKNVVLSPEVQLSYDLLKETMDVILENSDYCNIRLSKVFAYHNVAVKSVELHKYTSESH